jgi:hypothetical protein
VPANHQRAVAPLILAVLLSATAAVVFAQDTPVASLPVFHYKGVVLDFKGLQSA